MPEASRSSINGITSKTLAANGFNPGGINFRFSQLVFPIHTVNQPSLVQICANKWSKKLIRDD